MYLLYRVYLLYKGFKVHLLHKGCTCYMESAFAGTTGETSVEFLKRYLRIGRLSEYDE